MATAALTEEIVAAAPDARAEAAAADSGYLLEEMCFPGVNRDGLALRGAKVTIVGCGSVGMVRAGAPWGGGG